MNMRFDFTGRHALVTGGGAGIGRKISELFLKSGATVTVWEHNEMAIQEVKERFAEYEGRFHAHQVDVGNYETCLGASESLAQPIHFLVNNAGITRDKSFRKMSPEQFEQVVRVNLTGAFNCSHSCFAKFDELGPKAIINMASIVALYGNFGQVNYAAAKAGLLGLTKSLSRELGGKGFRVNTIAPGFTRTAMVAAMPDEITEKIKEKIPLGRLGEPEDIANACLFLCAEESAYINGSILSVDGGLVV